MTLPEDRWRLPGLERLGEQFREAERAEGPARARRHRLRRLSPRSALVTVAGALAAGAVALEIVSPAGAISPVNRAPLAAEKSKSVRFTATQSITLNGRPSSSDQVRCV